MPLPVRMPRCLRDMLAGVKKFYRPRILALSYRLAHYHDGRAGQEVCATDARFVPSMGRVTFSLSFRMGCLNIWIHGCLSSKHVDIYTVYIYAVDA